MDGRPTWTDCDEAGDYVVPNVLSPRDLVFRPDNMDETVPHTHWYMLPHWRLSQRPGAGLITHWSRIKTYTYCQYDFDISLHLVYL